MDHMIVMPAMEEPFRLHRFMQEVLPDFEKAKSWSIRGQYTHPKYANDWVWAIRVEARELTNAAYAFLQSLYRDQEVHRVVLVVHICDLLKDDLEKGEEALDDFDETVRILREAVKQKYGWVDVRPTSQLSVSRDGFGIVHTPEMPEMRELMPTTPTTVPPPEQE